MNRFVAAMMVVSLAGAAGAQDADTKAKPAKNAAGKADVSLKTDRERASYGIGRMIGTQLKPQAEDIDPQLLTRGLLDSLGGAESLLSDDEIKDALTKFQTTVRDKMMAKAGEAAGKNKAEGESFLDANKKKEGVKVTASGLQYKVLKSAEGKTPSSSDKVKVHYRGTLLSGAEFDSSYKRGEPAVFPVTGVIAGWTEALQLMKVGEKWQLFIPAKLAYGERGAGSTIPPQSTLVFEVELLGVEPGDKSE